MQAKDKKIYIAGSTGMVGSAIFRKLQNAGFTNITGSVSGELNLIRQAQVEDFFSRVKPQIVIHSAGKVGGILANNTYRADFIYENLMIESNVISAAFKNQVEKLIFLGSSCIYPKYAAQPIREEELLNGFLEPTNEPYAVAKIAGIKLCENFYRQYDANFFSLMPANLYGVNDNFDLQNSHVIPALIRKIHEAKIKNSDKVILWGTGAARREFMDVDDLASAVVFVLENIEARDIYGQNISQLNVGTGEDIKISELAEQIRKIVGYRGEIEFDPSIPDGTPRKLLDVSRLQNFGWRKTVKLEDGLRKTYDWFLQAKAFRHTN